MLMKRWSIVDGRRCLLKSGEASFIQELYNEVAASIIVKTMGLSYVKYRLRSSKEPYAAYARTLSIPT